jgi:hypothetical protein
MARQSDLSGPQRCPDCERAGQPPPDPADFYYYATKQSGGWVRRSAYCKAHMRARDKAWRKKKRQERQH